MISLNHRKGVRTKFSTRLNDRKREQRVNEAKIREREKKKTKKGDLTEE
jgi:hypothetical protein